MLELEKQMCERLDYLENLLKVGYSHKMFVLDSVLAHRVA
jgi:hypothetical protein